MPLVPVLLTNASLVSTTRLGLSGYSRGPFGNFADKTPDIPDTITIEQGREYGVYIQRANNPWEYTKIVFTGETFGIFRDLGE